MNAPLTSRQIGLFTVVLTLALSSCQDEPTGTDRSARTAVATSASGLAAPAMLRESTNNMVLRPTGALALPVNETYNGRDIAFRIVQIGGGPTGAFEIDNTSNGSTALLGSSNGIGVAVRGLMTGLGHAGVFEIQNAASTSDALRIINSGMGRAVYGETSGRGGPVAEFVLSNGASGDPALRASTIGYGSGVEATTNGSGNAVTAINYGSGSAGLFDIRNTNNTGPALTANTDGSGEAARFLIQNASSFAYALYAETNSSVGSAGRFHNSHSSSNSQTLIATNGGRGGAIVATSAQGNGLEARTDGASSTAVYAETWGGGWAGTFQGRAATSKGVYISTQTGSQGLQVVGGSKNAVVATASGARALYTEESTEVWFTDYGFARLTNGRAYISIDTTFAETVSLDGPYHVFVQAYGDADLYVARRTASGFEVVRRAGDKRAEFSYRVVARRKGFETRRLERAPWADADPGLSARPR